jgi:hypothetical protein
MLPNAATILREAFSVLSLSLARSSVPSPNPNLFAFHPIIERISFTGAIYAAIKWITTATTAPVTRALPPVITRSIIYRG